LISGLGLIQSRNVLTVAETEVQVYRGPSQIFDSQEVPAGVMLYLRPVGSNYKVVYPSEAEGWILKRPQHEIIQGSIWDLMNRK
jgi:hypothetical protein